MSDTRPIGLFDSGVGGTSIWREISTLLPHEDTIYLADSANAPYGIKPVEEITRLCHKNVKLLLKKGVKMIVVACNTATTASVAEMRATYEIPFIGIEPAIKPAALKSTSGKVGVLATKGTLTSRLFQQTSQQFKANTEFVEVIGTGLVELIEAGKYDGPETRALLTAILEPILFSEVDYLVLGCSHYPYLIPLLKEILPTHVSIIDSGGGVATQTKSILASQNLLNSSNHVASFAFYSNADPRVLADLVGTHHNTTIDFLKF